MSAVTGDQLREARVRRGLTVEHIAVETCRSADTIRRWESGRSTVPATVVAALRRILELDAS